MNLNTCDEASNNYEMHQPVLVLILYTPDLKNPSHSGQLFPCLHLESFATFGLFKKSILVVTIFEVNFIVMNLFT